MEAVRILFLMWLAHAVIGCALAGPILYLGRKRVGWANWEFLALIIPFLVWAVLMVSPLSAGKKSLGKIGEPVYISLTMPVLALLRVLLSKRLSETILAASFLIALCVAVAVFVPVPMKPE
jgi:hypothetical protein